jgi:Transcriptional regulator
MTAAAPSRLRAHLDALEPDPKARVVLWAAFDTFLQFGVRRTSMQDIADRAGMSRAALYLIYRNKDDIFRALMARYFAAAAGVVTEVLSGAGDPETALAAAFEAQMADIAEAVMASPHAEEMMSAKQGAAQDVVAAGEAALAGAYAAWLRDGAAAGRLSKQAVGPQPDTTAALILMAVFAVEKSGGEPAVRAAGRRHLARLFGRALRP